MFSSGLFGPRISPTTAEDCGTQFATLLFNIKSAARMLEILFYIYRLSSSADGRRGWVRERDRDRERNSE